MLARHRPSAHSWNEPDADHFESSFFSEIRFGTEVRYTGISVGYQLSALIGGAPTPLIASALVISVAVQFHNTTHLSIGCGKSPGGGTFQWQIDAETHKPIIICGMQELNLAHTACKITKEKGCGLL